jgi:hypothetical protein
MGWAIFWAMFLQTHLVTLSALELTERQDRPPKITKTIFSG